MYQQFMANPQKNSVRALAAENHLSMQRVDAILRLKGLEEHWKKVSTSFSIFYRLSRRCSHMMSLYRLVFKTHHMVKHRKMHGFLTLTSFVHCISLCDADCFSL